MFIFLFTFCYECSIFCIKMINQAQNYYFFHKYANNFGKNVKKAYFCKIELAKFA